MEQPVIRASGDEPAAGGDDVADDTVHSVADDLVDERLRDVVVGRIPEPQLLGEFGEPRVNSSTAPAATRFGQRPCTPDLHGGKILTGGPGRLVDLGVVKHDDGRVSTELELHPPEQGAASCAT